MSIVILRSTGPQNNPSHFTPEFCERLQVDDPVAYATDVLADFADPESGLLNPVAVRDCTRRTPFHLDHNESSFYAAALDPGKDRFTLVICEHPRPVPDKRNRFRVAFVHEWSGDPEACLREVAKDCRHYGLGDVFTDQYAGSTHAALARRFGLNLIEQPWTASTRIELYSNLASLVHSDYVELHSDPVFQRDLLAVKRRVNQTGGFTIHLPRTADGRHTDYAPALTAAINGVASAHHPLRTYEHLPPMR